MSTAILSRTFSSVLDKKLVLNNSQWAGKLGPAFNGWTKLRIGWRWELTDSGASITGASPGFMIGVMSNPAIGMTNGPLTSSCSHFFGMIQRLSITTISRATSGWGPRYGAWGPRVAKKVGSTLTEGSAFGPSMQIGAAPGSLRTAVVLEITKGSPNFSAQIVVTGATTGVADISSLAKMKACMNAASMADVEAELDSASAGNYTNSDVVTLAVDEGDGAFDSVVFAWTKTTNDLEISEVLVSKIA